MPKSTTTIEPGWYKSAWPWCRNAVHVHLVNEGRVFFTRRGIPHMSITSIESFVGLVQLPAVKPWASEKRTIPVR